MASVHPTDRESADRFLDNFKQTADESLTDFVQSIVVLLSIPTHAITTAGMRMMDNLLFWCTVHVLRSLVEADLIPQLINTLHPQSLSFRETLDIHVHLMTIMSRTVWLATPYGLTQLGIADDYEPKTVHETILEQVLVPSEKYIWYLCVNRFLIIDGELCNEFMHLLAELLQISPYFQPMMDFLLHIPVFLTIPSYLTFVEAEQSNYSFLSLMTIAQQERNKKGGEMRQMGKTVDRMLRMEGIEDVIVEKLRNDTQKWHGGWIATLSIILSNMHGMNLPQWE
ncbi:hypothetical protein BLNAU_17491 [Blattamonas nauphoetae]|uniref:Uncharacterized protein n=1 Tax=Blattamonas nauphoetae TaxID=2049346 RepID=A0ABQ9X729_9EUKA|nr:hypothetical protein BLNAU_17491 [Blattamonas nauphoetae]